MLKNSMGLLAFAIGTLPGLAAADTAVQPPAGGAEDAPIEMPVLEVVGKPEQQQKIPGSSQIVDRETLSASHVFTTAEALRKVAGVTVRDEEGFGLRPNIGVRGLNPTRSTKVLLLEDGIPLAFAPYGDNASYYHPPVERFDRIEVLKGAGQNIYGPQTVGGVVNYITPAPPREFAGAVTLTGGNREYFNGRGSVGGNHMLLDLTRKQGEGARDHIHSKVNDVNFKSVLGAYGRHAFTARANYYSEDSQATYSGLTDAEYANFGQRYNPFKNDFFKADRQGVSLTHAWAAPSGTAIITNVYANRFNRDWWRQSSSTTFNPVGNSDPRFAACGQIVTDRAAGQRVDPDRCDANIGNLREYYSYGVEPRLRVAHPLFGAANEFETGLRVHFEEQDRRQKIGAGATARDGTLAEDNERLNQAYSAFAQNRFGYGRFALTPALRLEHVRYERRNRLTGAAGRENLTEVIPSLGATYDFGRTLVFAGVHRGFSPPNTADLINNSGGTVDLDAEQSWNAELGLRARPGVGFALEATTFRNDFKRQIAVGSIAGGSVPLATGETLYEGVELVGRSEFGRIFNSAHNPFVELAYTWLPTAEQTTPLTQVVSGAPVTGSAAGKRLPYAPRHTLTAGAGYNHPLGVDLRLESVFVDRQFSDFANTGSASASGNGQTGEIGSALIWNAAASYQLLRPGLSFFITGKNIFDKVYIVDRTRGILPGTPRLVQAGVQYEF